MSNWAILTGVAILAMVLIAFEGDRKEAELKLQLQRQQGQIEGLQMQLERSQPNVNVTQNNETNGVKVK